MRTPKQMLVLMVSLWALGHFLLSASVVWAFSAGNFSLAETLAYGLIASQPLMAISIYGETRNAWDRRPDNANIAIPSLLVIAATWLVWQAVH